MRILYHVMGYYSHDMKINSHVMRIVFLSALQQNFECTGKVFGVHWNFKYAAMRRCGHQFY